jgi:hypothetical protein
MARTASMTVAEAEAAIGRRGDVTVTSENRGLVRKWFVAQGLPALFVGGLSMRELALAYNDTKGDQFARLLKKYEEAKEAAGEEVSEQSVEANQTFETASTSTNGHANSDAAALLELLRKTIGSSVDANQVREIVDATIKEKADAIAAELKDLISPVTRVQLIAPNGEAKEVDGPVHPNFPLFLKMAQARDADGHHVNIFLSGEASSGKTTACKQLSKALERKWYFNGAISMPHEMLGFIDAAGNLDTLPLDLARSAHVFTHPSVFRALGYRSLEHEFYPRGWNGDWAFGDHGLHVRTAAESYRRLLKPGSDVLFIPPVHANDVYLAEPSKWLRAMIAQHGGVQLEAA